MTRFLIAVVNHRHARLFTFEENDFPEKYPPALTERQEVINEHFNQRAKALWSNLQSGHNRSTVSHTYGYDDHRASHIQEFERRFVEDIVSQFQTLHEAYHPHRFILVAAPKLLGLIRSSLTPGQVESLQPYELAKDLNKFTTPDIYRYLAEKQLLPKLRRATT